MQRTRQGTELAALVILSLCFVFAGCAGVSNSILPPKPQPSPINPIPAPGLISLSPSSALVGGNGFQLTINGSNFASSAIVHWNGQPLPATFVSSQQMTATISASLVASFGSDSVSAQNPGSSESNALPFSVSFPSLQISSLLPNSVTAGAAPLLLTLNGAGFVEDASNVYFNGVVQSSTWVSAGQLQVVIPASYMAAPGAISVSVEDLVGDFIQPVGPPSNVATVTVTPLTSNPVPTLDSSVDTSVPAGWPGFELRVNGTNFVAASVLRWNGTDLPTMVTSGTQLRAAVPPAELVSPGAAQVSISNPSPGGGASASLPVIVETVPPDTVGVIDLSNIRNDFFQPDFGGDSAKVSGDGRFVAFRSDATDLAPSNPNEASDVYLRDTCIGAPAGCVPTVTSLPLTSDSIAISANGRFVGAMINPGANPIASLSLYDTCFGAAAGCVPATLPIAAVPDTFKTGISLSGDGRFAVFLSFNCTANESCDGAQVQVFLADTCAGVSSGCTPSSSAISELGDGVVNPTISPDARFVAFNSSDQDVSLIDTCQGAPAGCAPSTTLVSATRDGSAADAASLAGIVRSGGRYVAFLSRATNLVPGPLSSGVTRVFLRDMCTGVSSGCTPTTTLIAVAGDDTFSDAPSISADGRYVAFSSTADDLVPGDTNGAQDVFVYDSCIGVSSGCTPSTVRVSVGLDGTQGTGDSVRPTISSDGRFVAFDSLAKLAPGAIAGYTFEIYLARH